MSIGSVEVAPGNVGAMGDPGPTGPDGDPIDGVVTVSGGTNPGDSTVINFQVDGTTLPSFKPSHHTTRY